ncbi:hypothetical protein HRR37_01285 [Cronobacter sakazakii]|uniref:Uncharacterized protein n=1 Tax=Cronobacter sakazakii TaxID=28141 RepID=A0A853H534_CROSK|nr:hypothetical protein [Cronobacter sakazakii]NYV41061.1 hypothetical protein [Cronobacter sakazakii]
MNTKNMHSSKKIGKVHFLTFYTQGQPFDNAIPLTAEKNKLLELISPHVDSVSSVSFHDLKSNRDTAVYVKEFEEEAAMNFKTNSIGFLRWKPYIILDALKKLNYGDVLYYRDCNISKYPDIGFGLNLTKQTLQFVLDFCETDFFLPIENYPFVKAKSHVKGEVFQRLGIDANKVEDYLFNASIVIVRKSEKSISILNEWLKLCMDDRLLSPLYEGIQLLDFKWNTQEQAIINGIMIRDGFQKENWLSMMGGRRKFTTDFLVKKPRVAVLYAGQMRNYDDPILMKLNKEFFFDRYDCDVFVSTWNKRGFSYHHGKAKKNSHSIDDVITQEAIHDVLSSMGANVISTSIEDFDDWLINQSKGLQKLYHDGMNIDGEIVKATSFPQLYTIFKACELKEKYQREKNIKYDLVFRIRPDLAIAEDLPHESLYPIIKANSPLEGVFHLNSPKSFYPKRVYDIFFWGDDKSMGKISKAWLKLNDLLNDPFDNGLPDVDCCRLLYVMARRNKIKVIDVERCIANIYRNEGAELFNKKIKEFYN